MELSDLVREIETKLDYPTNLITLLNYGYGFRIRINYQIGGWHGVDYIFFINPGNVSYEERDDEILNFSYSSCSRTVISRGEIVGMDPSDFRSAFNAAPLGEHLGPEDLKVFLRSLQRKATYSGGAVSRPDSEGLSNLLNPLTEDHISALKLLNDEYQRIYELGIKDYLICLEDKDGRMFVYGILGPLRIGYLETGLPYEFFMLFLKSKKFENPEKIVADLVAHGKLVPALAKINWPEVDGKPAEPDVFRGRYIPKP